MAGIVHGDVDAQAGPLHGDPQRDGAQPLRLEDHVDALADPPGGLRRDIRDLFAMGSGAVVAEA